MPLKCFMGSITVLLIRATSPEVPSFLNSFGWAVYNMAPEKMVNYLQAIDSNSQIDAPSFWGGYYNGAADHKKPLRDECIAFICKPSILHYLKYN